jgi:glycosyltransferase involved in cell wall biosynthesis
VKTFANNRVLMLLENQYYPQDLRVQREATSLTAAGYRVSVICPRDVGQPWREMLHGVNVYRYWAPPQANGFWGYLWEYGYSMAATFLLSVLLFLTDGFDVVHAHNPPDTFVFIAAFYKVLGKRFIFDHHDLSPEMYCARFPGGDSRWVYRILVFLEKLTCRLADHVIATNESYKKVEMERDRVPEARITVVRNGFEVHQHIAAEPDRSLREKGKTIIGFVGVMGFQDGVDYLLRALHHLLREFGRRDFFCVLIGKGDAWPNLQALAKELALDEHLWFTGRVSDDELLRYLSASDVCVDPDPSNPFNDRSTMLKMMEYMALAKPIVAFDLPEHRFTAQEAAVYVTPNDERAFAIALSQLMDDPLRRDVMGAFGRRRIETTLAWRYSVPNLLDAYQRVLPLPRVAGKLGSAEARPARAHSYSDTSSVSRTAKSEARVST